jgi:hypothetical protein
MEDKVAIEILTKLLEKGNLSAEEKEAVLTAIGALGWTKLGKARIQNIARARKAEKEYDLQGDDKTVFE